ncbi:MAG: Ig-like domain-containing protein, partial [Polyangiales bacterium]
MRIIRHIGFYFLLLGVLACCAGRQKGPDAAVGPGESETGVAKATKTGKPEEDGFVFRLSEGSGQPQSVASKPPTSAEKLSRAEATRLLRRLPALEADEADRKRFAFRDRSKPPPRTGKTIETSFIPDPSADATAPDEAKEPLRVTRFAPEGDVPLAPHVSVSFSQPMVAVTSHADTVADGVPVELTPEPKGRWRWVGTKTLLFDPEVRLPQATRYTVRVKKGVQSTAGNALGKPVSFEFATPTLTLNRSHPVHGAQPLQPRIFLGFDQRIDVDA